MPDTGSDSKHHIVGAGIAGLATAFFLVRDGGVPGKNIHVYEQDELAGGSLDGSGDAEHGYLVRGGRMFEKHFACTFDLLRTIPSANDPAVSVAEEILNFNQRVPGSSNCRIVRGGHPAPDRYDLTLGFRNVVDINQLLLRTENALAGKSIDDWFRPSFFDSNFWLMWSTMFSFQRWHSLIEMRRYLLRFIHLFPGFTRIAGILRTPYNQYDSVVAPIVDWLDRHDVHIKTGRQVIQVGIVGDRQRRHVTSLEFADESTLEVARSDCVYLTLGSMTDSSVTGSNTIAPSCEDRLGGAWQLWLKLSQRHEGFGSPGTFCSTTDKTAWHSFTVSMTGPKFFEFMERFTGNCTGTGGLMTFANSSWILSIVMVHQPHFRNQGQHTFVFWGYGLRGDRVGDFVRKPMWEATGDEILAELFGHLRLDAEQRHWFEGAKVLPCRMPYITSQFMPRSESDRPKVCPDGAANFAVIGQYCELPRDCVFTVEYSVRSAWTAAAKMTALIDEPPPVVRTDLSPVALFQAAAVLLGVKR